MTLSRCGHSVGVSPAVAPSAPGHIPRTKARVNTAISPSAARSYRTLREGISIATTNAATYGMRSKMALPTGVTVGPLARGR